jgi:hypothetical protein
MTKIQMSKQEEISRNKKIRFMDPYEEVESFDLVLDKNIHSKYSFKRSNLIDENEQFPPIYHLSISEY